MIRAGTIARRGFSSAQPSIADLVARIELLEGEIAALRPQMAMTKLGKTNLNVSRISLGCAPLGGVYGGMDLKKAQSLVDHCFSSGINFFDTSPYYGDTKSESVLGHCLNATGIPRDEYVIATKVGRYGDHVDFSPERVTASVEESLNRLQTDYIDVIQCHDIEFAASMEMVINETLPALAELKRKGKVRHIGITGLPLSVMDFVLDRAVSASRRACHRVTLHANHPFSQFDSRRVTVTFCFVHDIVSHDQTGRGEGGGD